VDTAIVLTVKMAEEFPAATLTLAGNEALTELVANLTTKPPVGAAPVRVTVPVDEEPSVTLVGLRLTAISVTGSTLSDAEAVAELNVPVIMATTGALTMLVVTVKLALN